MAASTHQSNGHTTDARARASSDHPSVAISASRLPSASSGPSSGTVRRLASGATSETTWKVSASTGSVAICAANVTASDSATACATGERPSRPTGRSSMRCSAGASSGSAKVASTVS